MGAPTIYRWDDTDAPVLTGGLNGAGSAWNMLKKVLVEGYGSKAAAGWSMLFENVAQDIGVLRNDAVAGTGAIFQVIDDAVTAETYTGRSFIITGYESMSDTENGSGKWPATDGHGLYKSSSTTGLVSVPWVIIADDRAFYIFMAYSKTDGQMLVDDADIRAYFIGDAIPYFAGDEHFSLIVAGGYSGDGRLGALSSFNVATSSHHYAWRDIDGDNLGMGFTCMTNGPNLANIGTLANLMPHPYYGETVTYKPAINDGKGVSLRGVLPGFCGVAHNLAFENFETLNIDGTDHMVMTMRSYSNLRGQIAIDITETFRP